MAEFRTSEGTPYYPDEQRTADCPVASITPETEQLLNIFGRAARVHESSGAALFGTDLGEWPIWAVDAAETIKRCEIQEHNARLEAEELERRNR